MKRQIAFLGIILLSFQTTTAQQEGCEPAFFRSFMRSITDSMNIPDITNNDKSTQGNKDNSVAPLMLLPDRTGHLQSPEKTLFPSPSSAEIKTAMTSIGYSLVSSLDSNDTEAIRRNFHWEQEGGAGATAITIDLLNKKTGEKIRKAINQMRLGELAFRTESMHHMPYIWHEWWEHWIYKLTSTGTVSLSEMRQFKIQMDQLIQRIKDVTLKIDGKNIEIASFYLRTEKGGRPVGWNGKGHNHYLSESWLTASTSVLGPGTWVLRIENGKRKGKSITLPGQVWLMSEGGRNFETTNVNKNNKLLLDASALHGVPELLGERLLILMTFKLAPDENKIL